MSLAGGGRPSTGHNTSSPLSVLFPGTQKRWAVCQELLEPKIADLNKKIDHYNLLVPLLKQQLTHFPLHLEAAKALREGRSGNRQELQEQELQEQEQQSGGRERQGVFSSAWNIFRVFRST